MRGHSSENPADSLNRILVALIGTGSIVLSLLVWVAYVAQRG
jgi:hypothetical protein